MSKDFKPPPNNNAGGQADLFNSMKNFAKAEGGAYGEAASAMFVPQKRARQQNVEGQGFNPDYGDQTFGHSRSKSFWRGKDGSRGGYHGRGSYGNSGGNPQYGQGMGYKRQHKFYNKHHHGKEGYEDGEIILVDEQGDDEFPDEKYEECKPASLLPPPNYLKPDQCINQIGGSGDTFGLKAPQGQGVQGIRKIKPQTPEQAKSQIQGQGINKVSFDAYDQILCKMSGPNLIKGSAPDLGALVANDDDRPLIPDQEKDKGPKPYEGDDQFKPYNIETAKAGIQNEWLHKKFEWDDIVKNLNSKLFNNQNGFKESQLEVINATLSGRDAMALIPTGGGKSLTFQIPALINTGYSFIIMPLISLIEDQAYQLRQMGIKCCQFSKFGSNAIDTKKFFSTLLSGSDPNMRIIYLTPEKFVQSGAFKSVLDQLYEQNRIARFVVDEVHCVSHWGQDFRKDYRELSLLRIRYPKVPLLVLTATATIAVKYDVVNILKLQNVVYFQASFNRPNLFYRIRDKQKVKKLSDDIIMLIREKYLWQSGIIYCLSRQECEELCAELSEFEVKCDFYHARMTDNARKDVQMRWMRNEIHIIIATIAFGMGINKLDVRFIIHTTLPKSLENYAQECGRAGRDALSADCILYYSYADRKRLEHFIVTNKDNTMGRKNENLHALYKILEFCEEPYLCRRKILLNYLGEEFRTKLCNHMCDNCAKELRVAEVDFTEQARIVVYMVDAAIKKRMDMTVIQIVKFLQGKRQGINNVGKNNKLDDIKRTFFGRLVDYSEDAIKRIIMKLLINKVLKEKFNSFRVEQTILVYLIPGRRMENFKAGQIRIVLTDCVEKDNEKEYKKAQLKENKELKKKHLPGIDDKNKKSASQKTDEPGPSLVDTIIAAQVQNQQLLIQEEMATNLAKIDVESIIPVEKRKEIIHRFVLVRNSFLAKLAGKEYYVFQHTFTDEFIELLSFVLPQNELSLFNNELLGALSEENLQFIKKYAFAFVTESKHFVQQNTEEVGNAIKEFGQAYKLVKKKTPKEKESKDQSLFPVQDKTDSDSANSGVERDLKLNPDDPDNDKQPTTPDASTGNNTPKKFKPKVIERPKTDKFGKFKIPTKTLTTKKVIKSKETKDESQIGGSDIEVNEIGNATASFRKKIVRRTKNTIRQAIQKKYEEHNEADVKARTKTKTSQKSAVSDHGQDKGNFGFSQ